MKNRTWNLELAGLMGSNGLSLIPEEIYINHNIISILDFTFNKTLKHYNDVK